MQIELEARWSDFEPVQRKGNATQRALELSISNRDTRFRVIVPGKYVKEPYEVFFNGNLYKQIGSDLMLLPGEETPLQILDGLVGGRNATSKLGTLLGHWAATSERLNAIVNAAKAVLR